MTDVIDDYQPHYVTTLALATTLDGSLIGREIWYVRDQEWVEVRMVTHKANREVRVRVKRPGGNYAQVWDLRLAPNLIVKYRNKQT